MERQNARTGFLETGTGGFSSVPRAAFSERGPYSRAEQSLWEPVQFLPLYDKTRKLQAKGTDCSEGGEREKVCEE